MLNYIKAELWRASRHKGIYILVLILVALTALFTALMLSAEVFYQMASAATTTMLLGLLVAPLLTNIVDGGSLSTLKNEVSFGVGRRRIYLGKLIAGLLLGLGLCLLLLGGYLLTGWLVLPHSPEEDLTAMAVVGFTLLGALPIWCGVYGLCHMMAMLIPSTAGWLSIYYVLTFFGQPILVALIVTFTQGWVSSLIQAVLMPFSLLMPNYLSGWITWEYQVWCWTIGLGWMAVTTMLGLFCLDKKEIK